MKLKRNWYDIVIGILCILCLAGTSIFLIVVWKDIPEQVPGHYNAMGEIDSMSEKGSIIGILAISYILYIFMLVIEQLPQIWNTGVQVTEFNRARVYRIVKNLLVTVKFCSVAIFSYISIIMATCKPLPVYFTLLVLCGTFGIIFWHCFQLYRVR